jgi:cell division septation protein DedD
MNRTTVKRGIGAVILALVAAALLAFLLKDKAAQRQDVVDMALPGTTERSIESSSSSTRLPQLSTDNSGNGTVIAQAGQDAVSDAASTAIDSVKQTGSAVADSASDTTGKVIASVAAVGATAAVAATGDAAGEAAQKTIDFSVRAPQKASGEFRELDLVNNGEASAPTTAAVADTAAASTASATQTAVQTAVQETAAPAKPDQGTVIASTQPRKAAKPSGNQARLIEEKKSSAPKSARTAKVIRKSSPTATAKAKVIAKAEPKAAAPAPTAAVQNTPAAASQAKNGYAIQLLATSSASRANDLKKVMSGEGYPTYVTKTQQNGKRLYRVRIGQYTNRAAAAKIQAALKRRYKKNTYINRSAIVAR